MWYSWHVLSRPYHLRAGAECRYPAPPVATVELGMLTHPRRKRPFPAGTAAYLSAIQHRRHRAGEVLGYRPCGRFSSPSSSLGHGCPPALAVAET